MNAPAAASTAIGVADLSEQLAATLTDAGLASAIAGRIFALLMVSEEPLSQADIKARLAVSEGSVSEGTRSLETLGMIERVQYPKVRRDYFQIHPQAWVNCAEHTLSFVSQMASVSGQLLETVQGAKASQQVLGMSAYYRYLASELPALLRHQPAPR